MALDASEGDGDLLAHLDQLFPWRVDPNFTVDRPVKGAPDAVRWALTLPRIARGSWPDEYLRSRGLGFREYPPDLRMSRDGKQMMALIRTPQGEVVSYHRTLLEYKAGEWTKKRMIMRNPPLYTIPPGSSIRLGAIDGHVMGIAEGIEDALAAYKRYRVVTWSAVTASWMGKWVPPLARNEDGKSSIASIYIFSDNDFAGKVAAVDVWQRCVKMGVDPIIKEPGILPSIKPDVVLKDQADCLELERNLSK